MLDNKNKSGWSQKDYAAMFHPGQYYHLSACNINVSEAESWYLCVNLSKVLYQEQRAKDINQKLYQAADQLYRGCLVLPPLFQ